jgi:hypothetical protein
MAIAVPVLAVAVPASANSGNAWISNDTNNTSWNFWGIVSGGHNQPYHATPPNGRMAFTLVGCVTVNGASWCRNQDANGLCMNEVTSWGGNTNEQAVVADSCVQNDTAEEWRVIGVGSGKNILENRHTGGYINFETQYVPPCFCDGIVHTTTYKWTWNTPGA